MNGFSAFGDEGAFLGSYSFVLKECSKTHALRTRQSRKGGPHVRNATWIERRSVNGAFGQMRLRLLESVAHAPWLA